MKHESTIRSAIRDSINHTEIAFIEVPSEDRALDYLNCNDDVAGLDFARENNGDLDVWGQFLGQDFRLRIREAKHAAI